MEQYAKYLRKSRFDRDYAELSVEETLKRHEAILDKLAGERGYHIAKTYYEVVSGESIAARPEIQKLLEEVNAGVYAGVLVVDVERLARGNGADQAYISQVFQFSSTKIITPTKVYDPSNEFDEEYFEFGLFMSRREYKTINRRLIRGVKARLRKASIWAASRHTGTTESSYPTTKAIPWSHTQRRQRWSDAFSPCSLPRREPRRLPMPSMTCAFPPATATYGPTPPSARW